MRLWSLTFGFLLLATASFAQMENKRALEMAECGYLLGLAAEQLHESGDAEEDLTLVVGEVIDYTNLYYLLSGRDRPIEGDGLSLAMYETVMDVGRTAFGRRIVGISDGASNRLANTVMTTCREDLRLLGLKLRHG